MNPAKISRRSAGRVDSRRACVRLARSLAAARLAMLGLALALTFALAVSPPEAAAQDGTFTAKRAYDFTRAVGIRVDIDHANYVNNWPAVKSALGALKIKIVRTDGTNLGASTDKFNKVVDLNQTYGIFFDFVFGNAEQPIPVMQASVDKAIDTGAVLAFEGPNEWSKHYYNNPPYHNDWAEEVATYQDAFKTYLRANGWPTGPILAPTIWRRERQGYLDLKNLNVDADCTIGNLHYYHRNSLKPTQCGEIVRSGPNTFTTQDQTMDQALADQRLLKAGTWVTETGESLAAGDDGGSGVSPVVAAKYVPRLITEFYKRAVQKVFIFELLDSANNQYGLLDDAGVQRPAYHSVKNLMTLLDNPGGATFTPNPITLDFDGATGIRSLVLQKNNNKFYVLLWKDVLSADADQTQLVQFNWGFTSPSVKTYLPLNGTAPVNTWTNRAGIQVNVRDHVIIVEIAQ